MNHGRHVKHHNRKNDAEHNTQSVGSPPAHELVCSVQKRKTSAVNQENRWIPMFARARLTHIIEDAPGYTRGVHHHVVVLVKRDERAKDDDTAYADPKQRRGFHAGHHFRCNPLMGHVLTFQPALN